MYGKFICKANTSGLITACWERAYLAIMILVVTGALVPANAATYRLIGDHCLDIGNRWEYQIHLTEDPDAGPVDLWGTIISEVVRNETIAGYDTVLYEDAGEIPGVKTWWTTSNYYLTSEYRVEVRTEDEDIINLVRNNNPFEYAPVWVNESDTNRHFGHGEHTGILKDPYYTWDGYQDSYITFLRTEPVTVPAGSFDCVVVFVRSEFHELEGFWGYAEMTVWANPEVGTVKTDEYVWMWDPIEEQASTGRGTTELTWANIGSSIAKDKSRLNYRGSDISKDFDVWNDGTGELTYDVSISEGGEYFDVWPVSGSSTGTSDKNTHTVTLNRNNISPGQIVTGKVRVNSATADDSPRDIYLVVVPGYQLTTNVVGDNGVIEPNDGLYDAEAILLSEDFDDGNFDGWTIVDQGVQDAPSLWSAATGVMVQSSNIYSLPAGTELPKLATYAWYTAGTSWTDYQLSLTMRSNDDDKIGVMFRYQDENNYYRFSWDKQRALRRLVKCENGSFTLLAEDSVPYIFGWDYLLEIVTDGSILEVYIDNTLIFSVTDASFANGSVGLYCWGNEGSYFDNIEVVEQTTVTLTAIPDAGYCVKAWIGTDNDQSTEVTNLAIMDSNRNVTVEFGECPSRWTDYRFSVKMQSEDDDSIGVMFRCQDANNYYRFSWDKQRAFRRLVKCEDGGFTLLAEDSVPYTIGQVYDVEMVADGPNIEVWVDDIQIFSLSDTAFTEGTIGLYSWGNTGSYFDNIIVEDLGSGTMLLCEAFDDGDFEGWMIVDQGDQDAPSNWLVSTNTMVQSSNIYSLPTGSEIEKLGTFTLYEGQICDWDDLVGLVSNWLETNCDSSNNWCYGSDLDFSSMVEFVDFAIFAERWLQNSGW